MIPIYLLFFALDKTGKGMCKITQKVAVAAKPKAKAAASAAVRLSDYMKSRDPNHRHLRVQSMEFDRYKHGLGMLLGIGLVIGSFVYEQKQDPTLVKVPKHDGRSLVL